MQNRETQQLASLPEIYWLWVSVEKKKKTIWSIFCIFPSPSALKNTLVPKKERIMKHEYVALLRGGRKRKWMNQWLLLLFCEKFQNNTHFRNWGWYFLWNASTGRYLWPQRVILPTDTDAVFCLLVDGWLLRSFLPSTWLIGLSNCYTLLL